MSSTKTANKKRIERAKHAVAVYRQATGDEWAHDKETITDLLADLMHMCNESTGDDAVEFDNCLANANAHFVAERTKGKRA